MLNQDIVNQSQPLVFYIYTGIVFVIDRYERSFSCAKRQTRPVYLSILYSLHTTLTKRNPRRFKDTHIGQTNAFCLKNCCT